MTHLADTDGPDPATTEEQLSRFTKALKVVLEGGFQVPLVHTSNSGGAVRFPSAHFSLVRPGIMLYGYHTLPPAVAAPDLKPILSLKPALRNSERFSREARVSYNGTFTAHTADADCRVTRSAMPMDSADAYRIEVPC